MGAPCDEFYYKKPIVTSAQHINICNEAYVTEYSPITKTPIYSADFLTKDTVQKAEALTRVNSFHEETTAPLPRAKLSDYDKTYDRGHVVPCDDMPTTSAQFQSFTLANMVPQNPNNNRGLWKKLETEARNYTKTEPKVFVISGPIYDNNNTTIGADKVQVPTRLFKIIYLPTHNKTIVYIVHNSDNSDLNTTTIKELERLVPIKF
jgi:endonuclease G